MLQLTTFGGLTLALENELVTGPMTQRRRLALLALLAVARHRGMSRDKIVAYLWPESEAARARHSLNQQLYMQRQLLAGKEIFLGGKTLRLNPEVIRTDVGDFEDALDRGDLEQAASLYSGAFLDGFFVKDSAEFEQWAEGERRRLSRRLCRALVELARAATNSGQPVSAADWWRRAAEVDPLDSQIALDMVQALAEAGNPGGALQHALAHVERLDRELGVAPDRALVQLIESLKAGAAP